MSDEINNNSPENEYNSTPENEYNNVNENENNAAPEENTENATEEDAEIYADSQVDFNEGDIEGNLSICNSEEDCKEYVNRKIEQAFDFGTITEIEGLPKK